MTNKELFAKHKGNISTIRDLAAILKVSAPTLTGRIYDERARGLPYPEPIVKAFNCRNFYLKKEFMTWWRSLNHNPVSRKETA